MEALPLDLIRVCLAFLPNIRDLLRSARVSKRFYKATADWSKLGWESLDLSHYFDVVRLRLFLPPLLLIVYPPQITDDIFNNIVQRYSVPSVLKRLNLAFCISLTDKSMTTIAEKFGPNLTWLSLQYTKGVTEVGLMTLIPKLASATFLDFSFPSLSVVGKPYLHIFHQIHPNLGNTLLGMKLLAFVSAWH